MRYIDTSEFIKEMRELYRMAGWDSRDIHFSLADVECNIDMMPTADVQPVKRGRWIYGENDYDDSTYCCSVCGEPWTLIAGTPRENNMHYCPNCGSFMDGENNG